MEPVVLSSEMRLPFARVKFSVCPEGVYCPDVPTRRASLTIDGGTGDVSLAGTGVSHRNVPVVRFKAPNALFESEVPFWSRQSDRSELRAV